MGNRAKEEVSATYTVGSPLEFKVKDLLRWYRRNEVMLRGEDDYLDEIIDELVKLTKSNKVSKLPLGHLNNLQTGLKLWK